MVSSENGGCQGSAFCTRFKKALCCDSSKEVATKTEEVKKIEQSSIEYGLKYEHAFDEPLCVGTLILVTATPSEDIPRFAINVGSGDSWSDRCDIMFHFNPRMPQCYVVRNSRVKTTWGNEETTSFSPFPFKPGREFTVQLLVTEREWLVSVDGEHFCYYTYRQQPVGNAAWVQVTDISNPQVQVLRTDSYPMFAAVPPEVPFRRKADVEDGTEWRSNMSGLLSRGIAEGEQLVIKGRIRALPHSFHIDLMDDYHEWPHPTIHLHVNPRLCVAPTRSRQLVIFNSWSDGSWGSETRQATGRLIGGTTVTMRLVRSPSEWIVWCDDIELGEFPFRTDPQQVRAVRVRGDIAPLAVYTCSTRQGQT